MSENFRHKKQFGQNFLRDEALLRAIVADAGVEKTDTVLEIGAGAGALTRVLAEAAAAVVAYEIDRDLKPVLEKALTGRDNVTLVFEDFLKDNDKLRMTHDAWRLNPINNEQLTINNCGRDELQQDKTTSRDHNSSFVIRHSSLYKVVANLPYYITTPILFALIESQSPPESITVMVQREVAERLTAKPGTPDYGAVTAALRLYGEARITRIVGREKFTPVPNVDSAVVRIDRTETFAAVDKPAVSRLIKAAFAMRRKTLANNLSAAYALSKDAAAALLSALNLSPFARGETLSAEQFCALQSLL